MSWRRSLLGPNFFDLTIALAFYLLSLAFIVKLCKFIDYDDALFVFCGYIVRCKKLLKADMSTFLKLLTPYRYEKMKFWNYQKVIDIKKCIKFWQNNCLCFFLNKLWSKDPLLPSNEAYLFWHNTDLFA